MKKEKTKTWYIKKLDEDFSKYIRLKYADPFTGAVRCYTCDKLGHYKDFQNGHFISRSVKALRWSEDNCRVQCVGCNVFKNGNYIEYTVRMQREVGPDKVAELLARKNELKQWTIAELKKEREITKRKIENLEYA